MSGRLMTRRGLLKSGAILAGAGVLAGCAATPAAPASTGGAEVTEVTEAKPAEGRIILVYASQYSGPPHNAADDLLIAQFEEENPDIGVKKTTWPGQDFHDKLRLLATAGDLPDVFNLETKQVVDMASRNMLLDVTEMFNTESGLSKDDYFETEWDKHFFQGKMYLLSIDTQDVIVFYNKDLFDAKGIPYPPKSWDDPEWTYDKLVEVGTLLTEGEGVEKVWGFDVSRWWVYSYPIVWSFGGLVTNEDRTESALTMQETIDAFQFRSDLINKWGITPTPAAATEGATNMFTSGRLAMYAIWNPFMWHINDVPDLNFDIAVMPRGAAGAFTRTPQDGCAVGSTTKYPMQSFKWGTYLAGPAGQEVYDNQLGLGTPTLKSVAALDSFIHPPVAGLEHIDQSFVLDIFENGHNKHQDVTIKWPEMDKMISAQMDSLLDGAVTAEEFCATLDPQITELLQSIPEEQRGWVGD